MSELSQCSKCNSIINIENVINSKTLTLWFDSEHRLYCSKKCLDDSGYPHLSSCKNCGSTMKCNVVVCSNCNSFVTIKEKIKI